MGRADSCLGIYLFLLNINNVIQVYPCVCFVCACVRLRMCVVCVCACVWACVGMCMHVCVCRNSYTCKKEGGVGGGGRSPQIINVFILPHFIINKFMLHVDLIVSTDQCK